MTKICSRCKEEKQLEEFYRNRQGKDGRHSVCKVCRRTTSRKWEQENAESIRQKRRIYDFKNRERVKLRERLRHEENPYIRRAKDHRTRARKVGLSGDITADELEGIFKKFNFKCPLTGEERMEGDHFIALSTQKGPGSTIQNIIPLSKRLNEFKSFLNPFEWFEEKKIELNLDEVKFWELVEYLADLNNMTIVEYKDYVYKCYSKKDEEVI
ncbi:hypothetical protein COF41_25690 [Bacillus toyonensis]|uniref:hypothetical protein n=1 Tax=Bacillus toyonensis TaxID=155322 RepID=UPI000BFD6B74|nr:hypothetical protein [Bacillus toyonensis]MED2615443.1 hypothetical protein [Bacillus toyonensis]PHE12655.1 hypothetical protein COF41_25690 [Bacillus toyonensis]